MEEIWLDEEPLLKSGKSLISVCGFESHFLLELIYQNRKCTQCWQRGRLAKPLGRFIGKWGRHPPLPQNFGIMCNFLFIYKTMRQLFDKIIEKKTIKLFKKIACGLNEILVEINISFTDIDSIELFENKLILHKFEKDNYDIVYHYDDTSENDKLIIYENLKYHLEHL